ncbi:antibiotic biosynthesis monooxygenase [Streptomyces alkaliterrae]|uniref:Antibiotic biosynthesis monooxygenase n=1 Tax=Streptomyces alkaliterrae TaxID=2213162 RepID=A0A5P0YXQ4_9ACTN|nr:antibiotic biosynthesis monooxygenase [Streptomyces alkaliterrae]MBB1257630.1 antibiotic biosynthesis monooxygenase [Streptomyces alkaliterrae]MQS05065.1 antibiotic biosynthesis monooxygenase [Streptomyces alkaliterrae]
MTKPTHDRRVTGDDQVSAVYTWLVEPGREADFREWAHGIQRVASTFHGQQGVTWLQPEGEGRRFHAVVRFADTESLERWMGSAERAEWHDRLDGIARPAHPHLTTTGMESWFTVPDGVARPPARWKMALTTLLAVYPFALLHTWQAAPRLGDVPLLLRAAVLPLFLAPTLTYLVMPQLSRLLRGWLYPDRP